MQSFDNNSVPSADQYLLRAVAEELKLPLVRIARMAELGYLLNDPKELNSQFKTIENNSELAIQLVESYLMGLLLSDSQQSLDLEPVSIGAIINDTAHQLHSMAKQHDLDLEIHIEGRQHLVMANKKGLGAALLNIGSTLLTSQPHQSTMKRRKSMVLTAYPYQQTMITGVYGDQNPITRTAWQRGLGLYGRSRKPILSLDSTNGAGLFVADTIFRAMSSKLRPSQRQKKNGLAASLSFSKQLQLV